MLEKLRLNNNRLEPTVQLIIIIHKDLEKVLRLAIDLTSNFLKFVPTGQKLWRREGFVIVQKSKTKSTMFS